MLQLECLGAGQPLHGGACLRFIDMAGNLHECLPCREGLANEYIHPSPHWSAFREPSYGLGILNVLNSSHAVWQWHRNQDGALTVGDEVMIIRKGDGAAERHLRQWCAHGPALLSQVLAYVYDL